MRATWNGQKEHTGPQALVRKRLTVPSPSFSARFLEHS